MDFLQSTDTHSRTGYFALEWQTSFRPVVLFQESDSKITEIYSGELQRFSFSGYSDGIYRFSLCPIPSSLHDQDHSHPGNPSCLQETVTVKHYTLSEYLPFLGLGLGMFLAIWIVILSFSKKTGAEGAPGGIR